MHDPKAEGVEILPCRDTPSLNLITAADYGNASEVGIAGKANDPAA